MRVFLKKLISLLLAVTLIPVVVAMLLALFFGTPAMAIMEAVDMLRMRATAVAVVTAVDVIPGDEGSSRPRVDYAYAVNGTRYVSHRYAPGWWANNGWWTGGGRDIKRRFKIGQAVVIHYRSGDPAHACLEYGWFKWSIGFSLAIWGMVLSRATRKGEMGNERRQEPGEEETPANIRSISRWAVTNGMVCSGALLIFFGPDIVPIGKIGEYLAGFLAIIVLCALYRRYRRRAGSKSANGTPSM